MDTPTPFAQELNLDATGRIDQDCTCVGCGYNLRGLDPKSICPECATPIGRSAQGDFLRFSDPTWVETLADGMHWIVIGILLSIGMGFCVAGGVGYFSYSSGDMGLATALSMLLTLGVQAVYLVGYWKVTTPDPAREGQESGITTRQVVRFWAVWSLVMSPLGELLLELIGPLGLSISLLNGVIGIVGMFAAFLYSIQLAQRIPDESLVKQTRIVMWGMAIGASLMLLMAAGMLLVTSSAGATGGGAAGGGGLFPLLAVLSGGMCLFGVALLVFGIWSIVLAFRYRTAFRDAAHDARATWASETL